MPTDIVMPQMGESIFEGTITKWLKKPGDKVQRDEPLFEISTDKVDAEIPAPASGILQDIKVVEGNTVQVNTVVGTIAGDGEAASSRPAAQATAPEPAPSSPQKKEAAPTVRSSSRGKSRNWDARRSRRPRTFLALVRKIAREHDINLSQVTGTGMGGRITKQDIMAFLEKPQTASCTCVRVVIGLRACAVATSDRASSHHPRRSGTDDADA